MEVKVLFMAFAKGQESKEAVGLKRYIGVAPVQIVAVNPTQAQLEKLYGTEVKAPEYRGKSKVGEEEYNNIRLDFYVKTVPEKEEDVELLSKITFFLTDVQEFNKDKTKARVINKYGEDAWLPIEHIQAGTTPDNMAWFDTSGMRPAYRGEKDLTAFLKNFLVIPNRTYMDKSGERKTIANLADAEAQLGEVAKYFNGDISEIREIISSQPTNKVKLCFGVRTTDDNKQYQDIFNRMTLRLRTTNYSKLDEEIQNAKNNGAYPDTEFSVEPLHEYVVTPTNFSAPVATEKPSGFFN